MFKWLRTWLWWRLEGVRWNLRNGAVAAVFVAPLVVLPHRTDLTISLDERLFMATAYLVATLAWLHLFGTTVELVWPHEPAPKKPDIPGLGLALFCGAFVTLLLTMAGLTVAPVLWLSDFAGWAPMRWAAWSAVTNSLITFGLTFSQIVLMGVVIARHATAAQATRGTGIVAVSWYAHSWHAYFAERELAILGDRRPR